MRPRRYGVGARWYDVVSGEWPVYRQPRIVGIGQLRLAPGARVLDVGCGTGLNLPLVQGAVGTSGRIVGIDASADMLALARRRVTRHGWANVELVQEDAAQLGELVTGPYDAALFTYSLSVIRDWRSALRQVLQLLRPGGRVVVVDLALPAGAWRVFWPLARLACLTGGVDPHRAPWKALEDSADDLFHVVLRGGHVHVVAGTRQ